VRLEHAVVLDVFGFAVILASFGLALGIYAVRKINPRWFRVHAKVWRVATFSMEMGQEKPPGGAAGCASGELESGEDP
jgi:hypothetical protein